MSALSIADCNVRTYVNTFIRMLTYAWYTSIYTYIYIYTYICVYIRIYIYVSIYNIRICTYVQT